ncbi:MAG: hypothetical protein ACR2IH_01310 [Pyrinomonadaceae bacterium]
MVLLAFAETIQLFPDGTLFVHIALILLMIWVLNRTFFRPINAVIASREKFKGGRNVEADEILNAASQKQSIYSAEMLAARTAGYELIETERAGAIKARSSAIAGAKAATADVFDTQRQELQKQADEARTAISKEAEVMAERISATILKV